MLELSNEIVPVSMMRKLSSQTNCVNERNIILVQCKDLSSNICNPKRNVLIINEPCLFVKPLTDIRDIQLCLLSSCLSHWDYFMYLKVMRLHFLSPNILSLILFIQGRLTFPPNQNKLVTFYFISKPLSHCKCRVNGEALMGP